MTLTAAGRKLSDMLAGSTQHGAINTGRRRLSTTARQKPASRPARCRVRLPAAEALTLLGRHTSLMSSRLAADCSASFPSGFVIIDSWQIRTHQTDSTSAGPG